MKTIQTIFILTLMFFFSCNNVDHAAPDAEIKQTYLTAKTTVKAETENETNNLQDLFKDSINNLTIGDCFILKSGKLSKGFILTRIRKDLYDFTPIKFDSAQKGMSKFINGNMRMVPFINATTGIVENWGTECLSLMGQKDVKDFLNSFKKIGQLKFKDKAPSVRSSSYLPEYSVKRLEYFFKEQEMMWVNQNKTVNLDSVIIK
ncbi:MAG: hypothetical protein JNM51_06955 [Bacteroidia bacterium]|nr:hypothetical protein [Bacteroidia bacterium]